MLSGDLLSFVDYFEKWAEAHPDLKFFLFGCVEKGMEYARGHEDFTYPFAWLEQPSIIPFDNEASNLIDVFSAGIAVLFKVPPGDRKEQVIAQARSLAVLYDLRKKFRHDVSEGLIECEFNKMRLDPLIQVGTESQYGYRLEMEIGFNVNHLVC